MLIALGVFLLVEDLEIKHYMYLGLRWFLFSIGDIIKGIRDNVDKNEQQRMQKREFKKQKKDEKKKNKSRDPVFTSKNEELSKRKDKEADIGRKHKKQSLRFLFSAVTQWQH